MQITKGCASFSSHGGLPGVSLLHRARQTATKEPLMRFEMTAQSFSTHSWIAILRPDRKVFLEYAMPRQTTTKVPLQRTRSENISSSDVLTPDGSPYFGRIGKFSLSSRWQATALMLPPPLSPPIPIRCGSTPNDPAFSVSHTHVSYASCALSVCVCVCVCVYVCVLTYVHNTHSRDRCG